MATVIQIKGLDKLMANLKRIARDAPQAFAGALYRFAEEQIAGPARAKFVPVVTGALRNSIMVQIPEVVGQRVSVAIGAGGAAAPYALCVGARMKVQTRNRGMKHMNQIRQNDEVLTQAGAWKPVKQVFRYPVADGTTLISIHVPWRKGQEHILEATEHHHLMVERAGKNQWVQAGNLQVGDIVYQRMKQAHNKGVTKKVLLHCRGCRAQFEVFPSVIKNNRQFCDIKCYWIWLAIPGNNPNVGRPRPHEVMRKMRAGLHQLSKNSRYGRRPSGVRQMADFLDALGIVYEPEAHIGRYFVDFLCPAIQRIIEVDGAYWHRDQAKDIKRDAELLAVLGGGWEIVHIHYFNAKFSPRPLNPNPLPSVYYVAVNPGPETYVEPTAFKRAAITKIDREIYCRRMGSRKAVYDLEVADINSYVVSGMIVHNSVHENPRSGKTGGFSPSGAPYKNWSRVGQWKWLEAPALESAKHSGILIQDIRTELEKIARG